MAAGVAFAIGCFIFAFTATPDVHWIGPCFGIVIIIGELVCLLPSIDAACFPDRANAQRVC